MRAGLVESYKTYLNENVSSTLMSSKERLLDLKNQLITDLKLHIYDLIKEKINKNYSSYTEYMVNQLKTIKKSFDESLGFTLILNSKDYSYFKANFNKLSEIIPNPITLKQGDIDFIGGIKIILSGSKISYDFSIKSILNKKLSIIEMKFSEIVDDEKYRTLETEFEVLIRTKKEAIEKHLQDYDQIG